MIAWCFAPYNVATRAGRVYRYCSIDDFTAQIWADNGHPEGNDGTTGPYWAEAECLGDYAVVKIRAAAATLQAINAAPGVVGVPGTRLDDTLSSLTATQQSNLLAFMQARGYTLAEIQARFPNPLSTYTLGDVARFMLRRRLEPRLDPVLGIMLDGPVQPTLAPEVIDAAVA